MRKDEVLTLLLVGVAGLVAVIATVIRLESAQEL